jgi:ubiquinone/menaquinone biosynthesis C-methylase UbiE
MSVERHLNTDITPWTGEHLHRYYEAKKYLNLGDTVLDLACGSGYGSAILSEIKHSTIYGGDIEPEVIAQCKKDWANNLSLHFEVMDATKLRFDDHFFDKIISLETIEHLTGYRKMVAEFNRVTKPGGTVIISTPNIKISSPGGKIINPYHTQEFTYDELKVILTAEFAEVIIYGQQYSRYVGGQKKAGMHQLEKLLLKRGIRKLPYSFRNSVFSGIFGYSLYPAAGDFQLFIDKNYIEQNCHVLYAVCKK